MRRRTLILSAAALGAPLVGRTLAASASIVERFAATLTAHDLDAFAALFADDYVNRQLNAGAPPPAGVRPKTATVTIASCIDCHTPGYFLGRPDFSRTTP